MRPPGAVKFFLAVAVSAMVGAFMALTVAKLHAASSLTSSLDGSKVYDVRLVRGGFTLENIRGIRPLDEESGCYVVWNAKRAEVYRAGWTDEGLFDVIQVWGRDFESTIRTVVPLEGETGCFVLQTSDTHSVYKADWYQKY